MIRRRAWPWNIWLSWDTKRSHSDREGVPIPVVAVSGHRERRGVTNILLNHDKAARLALEHLAKLGHEKIAFRSGRCAHSGCRGFGSLRTARGDQYFAQS